jgi:hypothetical protein
MASELYREPRLTQDIKWEPPYSLGTVCVWQEYGKSWPLPPRKTPGGRDVRWVVKSSLPNLAQLVAYYAFRERHPALAEPPSRLPYEDPYLLHVFWLALPHIASPAEAVAALSALASQEPLAPTAAAYVLCMGLNAQASPYLGSLGSGTAMELLAAAQGFAGTLRARAAQAPGSALEAQALQELEGALAAAAAYLDAGLALGGVPLWGTVPLMQAVQAAGSSSAGVDALPRVESDPLLDVLLLPPSGSSSAEAGSVWAAFSPLALAEALALEDWDVFRSIPLAELLEAGWDSDRYQNTAQACQRFNGRYEALSLWVSAEVLAAGGVRQAAAVVVRALAVAEALLALGDFSGVFAVCTGLRREDVKRLSSVWALLPPEALRLHERLAALTDDASRNRAYKTVFFAAAAPAPRYAAGAGAAAGSTPAATPPRPAIPHLLSICGDATIVAETNKRWVSLGESGPETLCGVKRARLLLEIWEPVLALQARSAVGWVPEGTRDGPAQLALRAALRPFFFSWSEGPNKDVSERKAAVGRLAALSAQLQPLQGGAVAGGGRG